MYATRRNAVAGMLAIAAVPTAVAAAPATIDPIFALIEAHKIAWERYSQDFDASYKLYESLPEEARHVERVLIGYNMKPVAFQSDGEDRYDENNPIYAHSHKAIDKFFDENLRTALHAIRYSRAHEQRPYPAKEYLHAEWELYNAAPPIARAEAHAEFDRVISRRRIAREASGSNAAEDRTQASCEASNDVFHVFLETEPTTIGGILAKIDYMESGLDEGFFEECHFDLDVVMGLRDALAKLA
jgi:hypothetical protein